MIPGLGGRVSGSQITRPDAGQHEDPMWQSRSAGPPGSLLLFLGKRV